METIPIKCNVKEFRHIHSLEDFQGNLKDLSEEAKKKLKESIIRRGFNTPIFVWNDKILDGHQRLAALKELITEGYRLDTLSGEEVPIITIDAKDAKEAAELVLQYNSQYGEITLEGLQTFVETFDIDMGELKDSINLSLELDSIIPDVKGTEDGFEFDERKPAKYTIKRGDIYQLGEHRLMCGDSTEIDDVITLMNGQRADMIFTDPPWNVNYGADEKHPSWKARTIMNDFMGTEDFKIFMSKSFKNLNMASKPGAAAYIVMSTQEWGNMMLTLTLNDFHWSSTIIWAKDSLVLSRKDYHTQYEPIYYGWNNEGPRLHPLLDRTQTDLWNIDRPKISELHPTMKPVELVARAINNSSVKDEIILDLFGGSGTTIIAAEQTGRKCYMMELDPHYASIIIERWETHTNNKAEKL